MKNVCELYKRTNYLNKAIQTIIGQRITEYDIKSAGFNICKHFKFLSDEILDWLESLDRHSRHVAIGKLIKKDKELGEKMKKGFRSCRKKFFEANDVQEEDVLSIKKDAIYIIAKQFDELKFDNIEFIPKNEFTSYIYLNKYEFYINEYECQCKGIKDEKLVFHKDYMLDIIMEFCNLLKNASKDKQLKFIKEVATAYRNKELDMGYYRELNAESLFRPKGKIKVINQFMGFREFQMDMKYLDISYNYTHYIVPMFQMII